MGVLMSAEVVLFYVFAATALAGAIGVISLRNPMYSAISLLGSFLSVAVLFVLRHAEFLGVVQLFVYGGGIMVLFLFVIMLVNLYQLKELRLFLGQSRAASVLVVAMAVFFIILLAGVEFGPAFADPDAFVSVAGEVKGNSQAVAWILYRDYLLPFEIASVFLLVAMIGAVVLGRKQ
jgi:NADH-quinone oxidoreductase subunit J